MKDLNDPRILFKQLGQTWRVFLLVVGAEIIGGCIGLLTGHHAIAFLDFWVGGAFGAGAGLIGGMVWHYFDPVRRNSENREVIAFICITALGLYTAGWFLKQ